MKPTGRAGTVALVAGSVLFSLIVLELACRLLTMGPASLLDWTNVARRQMSDGDSDGGCSYAHDDTVGWSLPRRCQSPGYNIDANGFRLTPATAAVAEPAVLATGSSFTMGIEVTDEETWPTYLQNESGRKVLNAGVAGYSLDQSVLQTERLARQVKPLFVVLAFTPGDVWRTELKMAYSREKPYFAVIGGATGGRLELRNVPVPRHSRLPLPAAARWLGWSSLAHEIVERLVIRDGWYYEEVRAVPPGTGDTIACLLMSRLATLDVPVVVVAQYGRGYWEADAAYRAKATEATAKVLGCAAGLITLDLAAPLRAAIEARGLAALYQSEHHSPAGNRVVADLIHRELVRRQLLPQTPGPKTVGGKE